MLWLLFLLISALAISKKPLEVSELLSLIVFTWMALTARRNFGPFAIIAAPILERTASGLWFEWRGKLLARHPKMEKAFEKMSGSTFRVSPSVNNVVNLIFIVLFAAVVVWKAYDVNRISFVKSVEEEVFPVFAGEIIKKDNRPGRILNEYNWGGYLIWHLRDYLVMVDGRTDLFGDEIINEWSGLLQAEDDWNDRINEWDISYILIEPDRPLVYVLPDEWAPLYRSDEYVLFVNQINDQP